MKHIVVGTLGLVALGVLSITAFRVQAVGSVHAIGTPSPSPSASAPSPHGTPPTMGQTTDPGSSEGKGQPSAPATPTPMPPPPPAPPAPPAPPTEAPPQPPPALFNDGDADNSGG